MAISATLAINELIAERLEQGRPVLPLGFGEAGLPVHPDLAAALARAAARGSYGPVAGIPALREAAAGYWARRNLPTEAGQVIAGPGSKPLLYGLLQVMPGAVAMARPSWVSYAAQAALLRRPAHQIPVLRGHGGVPDPGLLDAAAAAARAAGQPIGSVVLTLPDNPTGTLASPDVVRAVCAVAERHDITIISDEIYRDLVHDQDREFLSPAETAPHRTVVTTGLSKSMAVGGWRIGIARVPAARPELLAGLTAVASELWSAPAHPVQVAAAWAFTEPEQLRARVRASARLHGQVANAVSSLFAGAGAALARPAAAFYLYPDLTGHASWLAARWRVTSSSGLAAMLLATFDIATLPGAAFGDPEERLAVRVATSMLYGDADQRQQALDAADPVRLPWIDSQLDQLAAALGQLVRPA